MSNEQINTKIVLTMVAAVLALALIAAPIAYEQSDAQVSKKPSDKGGKGKTTKVQAKVEVITDATNVNATDLGNATLTATVGGHTQTKELEIENDTDTSEIKVPFNFNRLTAQAGDQFSACFNSDILDSTCDDGTLTSDQKGKGKGNQPTKLKGSINLVL